MTEFTQADRSLSLTTPLGADALLPVSLRGTEEVSRLFSFELELAATLGTPVPFERLLGRSVTAELRQAGGARSFNGIVTSFSACGRDLSFARYRATVSPKAWLLTRTRRCRVFQHLSTPDILRRVLDGFDTSWKLGGTYNKRNYCVQYQESDFDFASRLMEEDGIWFSFVHSADGHVMALSDSASPYARVDGGRGVTLGDAAGRATEDWQVSDWVRTQQVRAVRCVLRDHSFQAPDDPLEAAQGSLDEIKAGASVHALRAPGGEAMELYDYPGGYAKRHDKVASDGGAGEPDQHALFDDRDAQARLRMEAEECAAVRAEGRGNCGLFTPGAAFELLGAHDAAGAWLLTRVEHEARNGGFGAGEADVDAYANRFACIPAGVRLRPARTTPRPRIAGVQTAVVVGPAGAEMFCDRYGRVKVQFFWDREGRHDADSSCWLRVAQVWAGSGWGAFFWPRVGHEVVVAFEDGDPDCPMVVGSVYNAANMPPYPMPAGEQLGGIRSASVSGSARQNFNSVVFNDRKGSEHLAIHSERNLSLNTESDRMIHSGRHKGERVGNSAMLSVGTLPGGGGRGGGSGGGLPPMEQGNSVAIPAPVNEAPGLNSMFVFGENMQSALGLNHQVAFGNNQQICVNPAGLLAGLDVAGGSTMTGLLGGDAGGNMQLSFGANVALTVGQAFEMNLGPGKIQIDGSAGDHACSYICCGVIGLLVAAYQLGYGLLVGGEDYVACANYTLVYQEAVNASLAVLMVYEMVTRTTEAAIEKTVLTAYGIDPPSYPPPNPKNGDWPAFGTGLALGAAIAAPLLATSLHGRENEEEHDAHQPK